MSIPKQQPQSDRRHETHLVSLVLAGDHEAFTEIYSMNFSRVLGYCLKRTSDRAEAEDLTQETFIQLYRSLKSFEGRSSLMTWTFGIAHNVCSRYFRHCSRWMVCSRNACELDEHSVQATAERRLDAARALKRCDEVLESSRRPAHQEIFHLRYGERMSIRSVAQSA